MSTFSLSQTGTEINSAIGKVHNADTTPTEGSTSMVTSGGVYTAVNNVGISALPITTEAEGIANYDNDDNVPTNAAVKDYVDNSAVPNYTGGESATLSGGLIIKFGSGTIGGDTSENISFTTAFPTGIKTVHVTQTGSSSIPKHFIVSSSSTSGFTLKNTVDAAASFMWTAFGY